MAIEMDTARIDPFIDAYRQWGKAANAAAYDVVFSVGGLFPAAVGLGVVAGLPVVVVNQSPGEALARLLRGEMASRDLRTVLEASVDRTRRLTVAPIEVLASEAVRADLRHGHHGQTIEASWLHIAPSDPVAVVTTDDDAQVPTETCQVAEHRGAVLQVCIDGRWSHARSLTVRARPEPLHVVTLEGDTP